jgi:hypothetical protein
MRKKVIYIIGPFRGASYWDQVQNIRRAEEAALRVWQMGGVALCPHLNTANFQGALPDSVWLEGDLEFVRRSDAVLCISGWQKSEGSIKEVAEAEKSHLPVLYAPLHHSYTGWLAVEKTLKQA